jgi:hypothetical protein
MAPRPTTRAGQAARRGHKRGQRAGQHRLSDADKRFRENFRLPPGHCAGCDHDDDRAMACADFADDADWSLDAEHICVGPHLTTMECHRAYARSEDAWSEVR